MCSRMLFSSNNLEDHCSGIKAFKKGTKKQSTGLECSSWFVAEKPAWMGDLTSVTGKIQCPKCNNRLGSYDWSGTQCSCGCWVSPAIQFPKSRVDQKPVRNPGNIFGSDNNNNSAAAPTEQTTTTST